MVFILFTSLRNASARAVCHIQSIIHNGCDWTDADSIRVTRPECYITSRLNHREKNGDTSRTRMVGMSNYKGLTYQCSSAQGSNVRQCSGIFHLLSEALLRVSSLASHCCVCYWSVTPNKLPCSNKGNANISFSFRRTAICPRNILGVNLLRIASRDFAQQRKFYK